MTFRLSMALPMALLGAALALAACASGPGEPPTVADRALEPSEISPGDSIRIAFDFLIDDPRRVQRVALRGLPGNTMVAGTNVELPLPSGGTTRYDKSVAILAPAADGQYNLELVFETPDRTYVAPLGTLAIRDVPSRILYTQFLPGNHAPENCLASTKLVELEYTVADDNGAADFAAPTLVATESKALELVFFPHWRAVPWLGGKPGIALERPRSNDTTRELVRSNVRIHCGLPKASLYEFSVHGQNVSSLTGEATTLDGGTARYYIE